MPGTLRGHRDRRSATRCCKTTSPSSKGMRPRSKRGGSLSIPTPPCPSLRPSAMRDPVDGHHLFFLDEGALGSSWSLHTFGAAQTDTRLCIYSVWIRVPRGAAGRRRPCGPARVPPVSVLCAAAGLGGVGCDRSSRMSAPRKLSAGLGAKESRLCWLAVVSSHCEPVVWVSPSSRAPAASDLKSPESPPPPPADPPPPPPADQPPPPVTLVKRSRVEDHTASPE